MYSPDELIRLAKRAGNPRRSYLLVNPLQGKHLAVAPGQALSMMRHLGEEVQRKAGDVAAVIGFAETATAIGAAVAQVFPRSLYLQTTREFTRPAPPGCWIDFSEEHSHAQQQTLFGSRLEEPLRSGRPLVLVDDEISTGRTCLNMAAALRRTFGQKPERIILASLISRLQPADRRQIEAAGIETVSLAEAGDGGYEKAAAAMLVEEPQPPAPDHGVHYARKEAAPLPDPRFGVRTQEYETAIQAFLETCGPELAARLSPDAAVTVLGTEECMYPAIRLGEYLEQTGQLHVQTHSSTRSPIGVGLELEYPVRAGCRLRSLYEPGRTTFLYNPAAADAVIVVTDAQEAVEAGMEDICRVYRPLGATDITLLCV